MASHLTEVRDLAHLHREIEGALDVRSIKKSTGAAFVQPIVTLTIAYDAQYSDGKDVPLRMVCLRMTAEQMQQWLEHSREQARLL